MSDDDRSDLHIAIVGIGARFAGANDPDTFWRNVRDGVESVTDFSEDELRARGVPDSLLRDPNYVARAPVLDGVADFDAEFFGLTPKEGAIMDPQHRHFLECAWEALEHAGHVPAAFDGSIGVYAGNGMQAYMMYNLISNPDLMDEDGLFLVRHTGNDKDFLATRAAYAFDLRGPAMNIQTACSTSLVAVHTACQGLLNGEIDMALAGGVTIELPHGVGYRFESGEILSPDGRCRAFDADSQGTIFGSGCGVLVLRRLNDALDDGDTIHAVIVGSAINNDGASKVGYLAPSVEGQARCIAEALEIAEVPAESISYVEAHGTGTPVGDPIEVAALTQAFRTDTDDIGFCGIGSVKTNIGHTDTAAGVAAVIKVAQALRHKQIPPSLNFTAPNPRLEIETTPFYVSDRLRDWDSDGPRRAAVNSLGVGGTNAFAILEEAPEPEPTDPAGREHHLLVVSARSRQSRDAGVDRVAAHVAPGGRLNALGASLADAEWTLQTGRARFAERAAVVVDADGRELGRVAGRSADRRTAFMFAGGGAQYPTMGRDLYASEPVYRDAMEECLAALRPHIDYDLRSLLYPAEGQEEAAAATLRRPTRTLPSLFAAQVAQARLWMSWGVEPSALIGHSMGEYTAAHLAGVFSLEAAAGLVALRGRLFESVPEGGMLSVQLDAAELVPLLATPAGALCLAAENAPGLSLASGPIAAIESLEKTLADRGVESKRIHIEVAAHSSMLDPILDEFRAYLRGVDFGRAELPIVGNLTGDWADPDELATPEYWVRHLREPVQFAAGVRTLFDRPTLAVEVGPGRTLATLARMSDAFGSDHAVLHSARHPEHVASDVAYMLERLGEAWCAGAEPDWVAFHDGAVRRRVPMPTYAWNHQRLWIEPGSEAYGGEAIRSTGHDRSPDPADWGWEPGWASASLSGPALGDGPVLVLAADESLGAGLLDAVSSDGRDGLIAVPADPGSAYARLSGRRVRLDVTNPHQLSRLFHEVGLLGGPVAAIIDARPASAVLVECGSGDVPSVAADDYAAARGLAFDGLLHLAHPLGSMDTPVRLVVVTRGACEVAGEGVRNSIQALAHGPVTVLPSELEHVDAVAVDIGESVRAWRESAVAALVVREALTHASDRFVALRGERRLIRTWRPVPLPESGRGVGDGCTLITGGLGALGLAAARRLAAPGASLLLLARTGLPPRAAWPLELERRDARDRTRRRIEAVLDLESAGARVAIVEADVCNANTLREAIQRAEAELGVVRRVVHTAGVIDDAPALMKSPEDAEAVLAPKVRGTLNLDACLGDRVLDAFVLYSSVSASIGMPGQIDYAAANAFLGAFAHARRERDGTACVAVGWPAWTEVGMAAELAAGAGVLDAGEGRPTAHPLLGRCVLDAPDAATYLAELSTDHWVLDDHRLADGRAVLPGTGYVELARAAFLDGSAADRPTTIRDVAFLEPFFVDDAAAGTLRVDLARRADGMFDVRFTSGGPSFDAVEHCRAVVGTAPELDEKLRFGPIRKRCGRRVDLPAGPKADPHVRFGARWSCQRRTDFGAGEALVTLDLDPSFADDVATYRLHPALLDFAVAGAQELIPGAADAFHVPAGYGELRFSGTMPAALLSHVRLVESADGFAVFDITIADARGRVVVEVSRFTMTRVDAPLEAAKPARRSGTGDGGALAESLRRGVSTAEGVEALHRVLGAVRAPELVVSPVDFAAILAEREAAALADQAPPTAPADDEDYVAPETRTERAVARIWGDAIGLERVGVESDFFELGGHSLVGIRITSRVNQMFGLELPLRALFEAPTVRGMAGLVDDEIGVDAGDDPQADAPSAERDTADATAPSGIPTVPRGGLLLPSLAQEALWFIDQLQPGSRAYTVPMAIRLRGPLDVAALARAVSEVVARHESTRMTFAAVDGAPMLRIAEPAPVRLEPSAVPGRGNSDAARSRRARAFANDVAAEPFDLARGPLFRAALGRLADDDHVLVVAMHHSVSDEWSLEIVFDELGPLYDAFKEDLDAASPLPPLEAQYADFVAWRRRRLEDGRLDAQLDYWRGQVGAAPPVLELPGDRTRPPTQSFAGARHVHAIDDAVASQVRALAAEHGVTNYIALLAAFQTFLYRLTGQDDLLVASPSSTRQRTEVENVIGYFINTILLRADLSGRPDFRAVLARTRAAAIDAFANADLPFDRLVRAVDPPRDPSRNPLYQVMFALFPSRRHAALGGLEVESLDLDAGGAHADLTLYMADTGVGLKAIFEYNTDLFDAETIGRYARSFEALLGALVARPDVPVSELPVLDAKDTAAATIGAARMAFELGDDGLHTLFEARRKAAPDALAVAWDGGSLSYRALDEEANRIARTLLARGVRSGDFVGVCTHRHGRMLAALLGVLKTGAAYLPLDPGFPGDRLAYMLADSGAPVVVAEEATRDVLAGFDGEVLSLDGDAEEIAAADSRRPRRAELGNAYVIYTSGSTGRPKGVVIPHRAAVNFLRSMAIEPGFGADDRLLAVTTISFDISVLELFLPLSVGGSLWIADKATAADGAALAQAIEAVSPTVLQATPATWRLLVQAGWPGVDRLRALCGGEPLPPDLAADLLARTGTLWNMYGPTETTIWSTVERIDDPADITIGHPIANTTCYVLDPARQPVPNGVPGTLWIGGEGVALGYLNRPRLTEERFVDDPFTDGRMYDTGDVVRRRGDGRLEYISRRDNQVKVRGFRIELGEIEAAALADPTVARAVAAAHDFGGGDVRLALFYVAASGADPDPEALRARLRSTLPEYMVPSLWRRLDALPLTANGKIDRKALPDPSTDPSTESAAPGPMAASPVAVRTVAEKRMVELCSELLRVEAVRLSDNFFDLGGHSLLAMRLIATIEEDTGHRFNPLQISLQTLGQLAATLPDQTALPGQTALRDPAAHRDAPNERTTMAGAASVARPESAILAGFFDSGERRLFGVLHRAQGGPARGGVVMCQPAFDECADTLRAFRLIADRLAGRGFDVLRFDWSGTGDSSGDGDDARWEHWIADVQSALAEVRRHGSSPVTLIGARLGATLAVLGAIADGGVHRLLAWEPVLDGRMYLEEKLAAHRSWLAIEARERPPSARYHRDDELLGYPLPRRLAASIRAVDLSRLDGPVAGRGDIVWSGRTPETADWMKALRRRVGDAHLVTVDEPPPWDAHSGFDAAPVPARTIEAIVRRVAEEER